MDFPPKYISFYFVSELEEVLGDEMLEEHEGIGDHVWFGMVYEKSCIERKVQCQLRVLWWKQLTISNSKKWQIVSRIRYTSKRGILPTYPPYTYSMIERRERPSTMPKKQVVMVSSPIILQLCPGTIFLHLGSRTIGTIATPKLQCHSTARTPTPCASNVSKVTIPGLSSAPELPPSSFLRMVVYNNMAYNLIIQLVIGVACGVQLHSNYNYSLVHEQALFSEPLLLTPRHLAPPQRPPLIDHFPLRKYELKDTGYQPDDASLGTIDQHLLYQMDLPPGVFAFEVLSVENYHLLEIRQFQVALNNPSGKFTLCVNQIVVDSEEVRRNDDRGALPLCLSPGGHQAFNFSLYVASPQPALVRVTLYFLVELMDGRQPVEEKAYARKIYATVSQNHLRLETALFKNCPATQAITLRNYQSHELIIRLESRRRLQTVKGEPLDGQVKLRPGKEVQIQLEGKATQLIVHSHSAEGRHSGEGRLFPSLLLKTHCEEALSLDYHNIGILTDEKMVVDVPLTVTSKSPHNITLLEVNLQASSLTVQLQGRTELAGVLAPMAKSAPIAMMRIHSSKQPQRRSSITVRLSYSLNGEQRLAIQRFVYVQIRNAVSAGQRKHIDVTKYASGRGQTRFPIKNNLNVPIYLNRITVDQSIFQLSWQSERRRLIYPNHSAQEFSLVYTGPLNLPLSSLKYLALLQFNGHILVAMEITIYDHTLQCLYNNIVHKCAALPPMDFGYFRDPTPKSKQLVVRNWNPEPKMLSIAVRQQEALKAGYNLTLRIYRPGIGSQGDNEVRQSKPPLELLLKPQQFLLLQIQINPLQNATTARLGIDLTTAHQSVTAQLMVRLQNGTIALIPQVVRFTHAISRQIQYINLVSTYSQQYSIKEVVTNLTGLTVHFSQPAAIMGNEWIGMSLLYDPTPPLNASQMWSSSLLQHQYLQHRLKRQFSPIKYARVRLTTTTDLEANSTVIVQQQFPRLIAEGEPCHTIDGVYSSRKLIMKRKRKSTRKEERHTGEVRILLSNPLEQPIQYSLLVLSEPKLRDVEYTIKNFKLNGGDELQEGYMCVSEQLRSRWGITAATIKTAFRLARLPEECSLQKGANQPLVLNPQKQRVPVTSNITLVYLAKSIRNGCPICYRFTHRFYVHRLINTEFPNKLLDEEGLPFLLEFLKAELNHLQDIQMFQLDYLDMHSRIKEDFYKFCEKFPDVMLFRFCHYLNIRLAHVTRNSSPTNSQGKQTFLPLDRPLVLQPGESHTATFAVTHPPSRQRNEFFIVVANNLSHFQTHRVTVVLEQPFLRVEPLVSHIQEGANRAEETLIRRRANELLVLLSRADYREEQGVIAGSRSFQLINQGEIDIEISHMGIDEKEVTCSQGNIWINGLTCPQQQLQSQWAARAPHSDNLNQSQQRAPVVIRSGQTFNLTLHFEFLLPRERMLRTSFFPLLPESSSHALYLYDGKGYYFKLTANFRIGEQELRRSLEQLEREGMRVPMVSYHSLNILSLLIICLVLLHVRGEEGLRGQEQGDPAEPYRLYRPRKLGRIIRQSSYSDTDSSIGTRLVKRAPQRPVHCISEDLLLSVREAKQRELKKYFNESEESEIGGLVGYNHHLSLSHSISYDQDDHDNNQQPLIIPPHSPRIGEEEDTPELTPEHTASHHSHASQSQSPEPLSSPRSSSQRSSHSSQLPQGVQVDVSEELDADSSWFDFNQESSLLGKSAAHAQQREENEFYDVFRSGIKLRKEPDNNHARYHSKRD